jgi:hypothetical protein
MLRPIASLHVAIQGGTVYRLRNHHYVENKAVGTSYLHRSSLRPKTLKHEMLQGCHSLCYNVSFERDIVSYVLLFVRLIVVFSSHMDVKVHATHGLYNILVQLATCSDAIGCNVYPFPAPTYCYNNVLFVATCTPFPVPTTVVHIW